MAAITSLDLMAELRTARATLNDQLTLSQSVDIDGVYPDAINPDTVTVTCVAHLQTAAGETDQPCATTVTVAADADGQPVVTAAQ